MILNATSPVHFHLERGGTAVIGMRLTLWRGAGGPNPEMVTSTDFADPAMKADDRSVVLDANQTYTCVMSTFVHQALGPLYRFRLEVDQQAVFRNDPQGDVSQEPSKAVLLETQFDIRVTA